MKRFLSYIPFAGVLTITVGLIYIFALTSSLGTLSLIVPSIITIPYTLDLIQE